MRVLNYLPCSGIGGTELCALNLCRQLPPGTAVALFEKDGPVIGQFRSCGIPVLVSENPSDVLELSKALARTDILHFHLVGESRQVNELLAHCYVPALITLQWFTRLAPTPIPIICPSNAVAAIQHPANETHVVYNGVDLLRFRPVERRGDRQVVARLCRPEKSSRYFWEVAKHLLQRHPQIELWIIGEEGDTTERIKFMGIRNDVDELLPKVDLLLHTPRPRQGALDLAVLEAMASGVPIVAFDVECVRECLPNSETGMMVPFGDTPAMVRAADALLEDESRRRRMGSAARAVACDRYSVRQMAKEYQNLYRQISCHHQNLFNAGIT